MEKIIYEPANSKFPGLIIVKDNDQVWIDFWGFVKGYCGSRVVEGELANGETAYFKFKGKKTLFINQTASIACAPCSKGMVAERREILRLLQTKF